MSTLAINLNRLYRDSPFGRLGGGSGRSTSLVNLSLEKGTIPAVWEIACRISEARYGDNNLCLQSHHFGKQILYGSIDYLAASISLAADSVAKRLGGTGSFVSEGAQNHMNAMRALDNILDSIHSAIVPLAEPIQPTDGSDYW